MTAGEAKQAIAERIAVARADVVAAKAYLAGLGTGQISIEPQSREWALEVSPGTPTVIGLEAADVSDQITRIARYVSARLALASAAWELVHAGVFFHVGRSNSADTGWEWTMGGHNGGFSWEHEFVVLFPDAIWRPAWHTPPSDLFDADLYIQRLAPLVLHAQVEHALRMSLACFRRELWVPCVAMLGAASEGAWIEMGRALVNHFPSDSSAVKLGTLLADGGRSTKAKISAICHFYERPICDALRKAAAIDGGRLRQLEQWSDQVRESRNVLHWGATPSVPNTYEKVAVLLMDAVSELTALHQIRNAC